MQVAAFELANLTGVRECRLSQGQSRGHNSTFRLSGMLQEGADDPRPPGLCGCGAKRTLPAPAGRGHNSTFRLSGMLQEGADDPRPPGLCGCGAKRTLPAPAGDRSTCDPDA